MSLLVLKEIYFRKNHGIISPLHPSNYKKIIFYTLRFLDIIQLVTIILIPLISTFLILKDKNSNFFYLFLILYLLLLIIHTNINGEIAFIYTSIIFISQNLIELIAKINWAHLLKFTGFIQDNLNLFKVLESNINQYVPFYLCLIIIFNILFTHIINKVKGKSSYFYSFTPLLKDIHLFKSYSLRNYNKVESIDTLLPLKTVAVPLILGISRLPSKSLVYPLLITLTYTFFNARFLYTNPEISCLFKNKKEKFSNRLSFKSSYLSKCLLLAYLNRFGYFVTLIIFFLYNRESDILSILCLTIGIIASIIIPMSERFIYVFIFSDILISNIDPEVGYFTLIYVFILITLVISTIGLTILNLNFSIIAILFLISSIVFTIFGLVRSIVRFMNNENSIFHKEVIK